MPCHLYIPLKSYFLSFFFTFFFTFFFFKQPFSSSSAVRKENRQDEPNGRPKEDRDINERKVSVNFCSVLPKMSFTVIVSSFWFESFLLSVSFCSVVKFTSQKIKKNKITFEMQATGHWIYSTETQYMPLLNALLQGVTEKGSVRK